MRAFGMWARLSAFCASLAIAGFLTAPSRAADTYPEHKVRVIVPFAAGGPTDVIGRMVAERLSEAWGQQLYVENMPGAGGNLRVETGAVAASPNVVTVHPSVPAKDLKELIALIKANPGKYSFAQPATGSTPHLAGELFKQTYNLDLVTVPFNAAPLAINSTLGNHTPDRVYGLAAGHRQYHGLQPARHCNAR